MTATLKSVAAAAGVSFQLVSGYLNGTESIRMSDQTRARIARAIADLNYVPNNAARSLRTARSNVVGVIIPRLQNPVYAEMLNGIYDAADTLCRVVMLGDTARLTSGSKLLSHIIARGSVDGVIIRRTAGLEPSVLEQLDLSNVPVLYLDDERGTGQKWISIDDRAGIAAATQYLLDRGHTRIAMVGGSGTGPAQSFTERRLGGYADTISRAGHVPMEPILLGQSTDAGLASFDEFSRRWRGVDRPSAVVVNNSTTALGFMARAQASGLTIPDDLSIVGYHDILWASLTNPRITAVEMPMHELGEQGVRTLIRMIDGERPRSRLLKTAPTIVERDSVRAI